MHVNRKTLNRMLDEALEMTFPASDPVAVAAPGSTSDKGETEPERGEPPQQADRTTDRTERRER